MVFNFVLIIPYGARGAAVATIIAEGTVYLILSIKMRRFYRNVKLYGELWKYSVAGLGMFAVGLYIRTFNLTIIPSICVTVLSCVVVYFILLNILNAKIIRPIKEIAKQFRSK